MDHPNEVARLTRGERPLYDARDRGLQALLKSHVFAGCERAHLAEVAALSVLHRIARRRRLYSHGEPVAGLYVVADGRVRVVRGAGETRALTVAYRGPGDVIGEIAITQRSRHVDTATALDTVDVLQIPPRCIEKLLGQNAGLPRRMIELMVERRLDAERRIESLLLRTVESRVAEFLLDAANRYGVPDSRGVLIGIKYTHQEIADYVGSTRETVTLTLGELKRRSLVLFDHRRIVVRDAEALASTIE
jgi:CRP/FNR family transcriptional regulator, cyclic AMP receptor protein